VIRVAAVGDVHMSADARGSLHDAFAELPEHADVLLLAGDLTRTGTDDELHVLLTSSTRLRCRNTRCSVTTTSSPTASTRS